MKEVNINWKMLTNLRPDNKADEIFFAQWEIKSNISGEKTRKIKLLGWLIWRGWRGAPEERRRRRGWVRVERSQDSWSHIFGRLDWGPDWNYIATATRNKTPSAIELFALKINKAKYFSETEKKKWKYSKMSRTVTLRPGGEVSTLTLWSEELLRTSVGSSRRL